MGRLVRTSTNAPLIQVFALEEFVSTQKEASPVDALMVSSLDYPKILIF
jgi:hypothetical protein